MANFTRLFFFSLGGLMLVHLSETKVVWNIIQKHGERAEET